MGVHRRGRARLPRDLAYREPYVPPPEGEITSNEFDRRLAALGWTMGSGDTRTETPPMTKTRTSVNDDVRVPPHFNEPNDTPRVGNGGDVHRGNDEDDQDDQDEDDQDDQDDQDQDDQDDQDEYDQDEEESDERVVKSGDDDDLDEDESDLDDEPEPSDPPVNASRKPEPEPEPEPDDEPDMDDSDEDEPEPVRTPTKKTEPTRASTKKSESTKRPEPEPEHDPDLDDSDEDEPEPPKAPRKTKAEPKLNKPPRTEKAADPQQPSQELIDAVAGALTGPVADAVAARLEATLSKPQKAEKAERAEKRRPAPEPEVAQVQVQPFTSDHVYALARRPPTSLRGVRDLAMLMLGLSMALRRSEIVALRLEHVAFSDDGIAVVMPKSRDIQFVPTVVDRICTVAALANWIVASGIKGGYLFRRITNDKLDANRERRLQKKETTKAVKRAMRRVGLDPAGFDWRSLRAGFLVAYEESRTVDQKIDALRRGS